MSQRLLCHQEGGRPILAGAFEPVYRRVAAAPTGEPARVLSAFASSLLNGDEFVLTQIERLPDESDKHLCLAMLDYCMTAGLSECERRAASAAFAPFVEIHAPGARH